MEADTLTEVASSNLKSIRQDLIGSTGVLRCGEYDIEIMYIPRRSYIGEIKIGNKAMQCEGTIIYIGSRIYP